LEERGSIEYDILLNWYLKEMRRMDELDQEEEEEEEKE